MINDTTAALQMRWVPVAGPDGRTHMECVWLTAAQLSEQVATPPTPTRAPVAATHAA